MQQLEATIENLKSLKLAELRVEWGRHFNEPYPKVRSADFLRRLIAWKLQERVYGGIPPDVKRELRRLAKAFERNPDYKPGPTLGLSPGVVLAREWQGVSHRVQVLRDGFDYDGKRYGSLSEIARYITGTRWSGPAFFGLNKRDRGGKR